MHRRMVTADRNAVGDRISTPSLRARCNRRNASWTMSSVSPTLATMRYAIENSSLLEPYGDTVPARMRPTAGAPSSRR